MEKSLITSSQSSNHVLPNALQANPDGSANWANLPTLVLLKIFKRAIVVIETSSNGKANEPMIVYNYKISARIMSVCEGWKADIQEAHIIYSAVRRTLLSRLLGDLRINLHPQRAAGIALKATEAIED